MPNRRARAIAAVALLPALAVVAGCTPPAATPLPAPTCVPAGSGTPASGGGGAASSAASSAPVPTLPSIDPNATPLDVSSGSGVIVYADGPLGQGPAFLHVVWPDRSHEGRLSPQVIAGFSVSPNGRTVELDGVRGPYLVDVNGTNERPLPVGAMLADTFRWSPDSKWLVFHGWSQSDPSVEGIYEVVPGGCQPVRIDVAGAEHDIPIGVGPDGSILAYGDIQETSQHLEVGVIYLERPRDRKRVRISPAGALSVVEPSSGEPAAWAPDGTHIVLTSAAATAATWSAAQNGLSVVDPDGTNLKTLIGDGIVSGVRWAPSSQWIATTRVGPGGAPQVYVIKVDGKKASYLTSFQAPGGCCPVWSPDGKSLLIWGGTIIPFEGSGVSTLPSVGAATTYAYEWVKPTP